MIEKLKDIYYFFYRLFHKIKDIPKEIKWFYQRGIRGYSDKDSWSLDWYLAKIISEGTKKLSKNIYGHPCQLKNHKEWKRILYKISKGFAGLLVEDDKGIKIWERYFGKDWSLEKLNEIRKHKNYKKYRREENELRIKTQKEFQESAELFIRYFRNLWD